MKKISHRQEMFPTHRISLTKSGSISDPRDMEIRLKEVLNRELKSRNESVHAVSLATGIPSSTLHAWTGGQLPSAKNLKHLKKLSEYLSLPISVLLFNEREDDPASSVLFQTMFVDQDRKYRLVIEKIKK